MMHIVAPLPPYMQCRARVSLISMYLEIYSVAAEFQIYSRSTNESV